MSDPKLIAELRDAVRQIDVLRAENLALHEKASFLESREVCAAAHDNVETCGYCQRDALREVLHDFEGISHSENEALRAVLRELCQEIDYWGGDKRWDRARALLAEGK